MNHKDHTPEQLAQLTNNVGNREIDDEIKVFFRERPSKDIEKFYGKLSRENETRHWIEPAKLALQLKRAEETADRLTAQMDKLIQHTERLTAQTDSQIQNSLTLFNQTAILIVESKSLTKFTKVLIWLTGALLFSTIVLVCLDWHKHN